MTAKPSHFLVVGAGLAGLCVSIQLLRKGSKVTLLDAGYNHSSSVAAGMINPLVFRRTTKSWRVDEFLPYLTHFYRELEQLTHSSFFHPVEIRRLFAHTQEQETWIQRQDADDYEAYMHPFNEEDAQYSIVSNEYGSGRVKDASFIQVGAFLSAAKTWVAARAEVRDEVLNYSDLKDAFYKGVDYAGIVFCEGYQGKTNPWFSYLPMDQTKGETLLVRSHTLPEDESLNRKCFVLPVGHKIFKIGATYGWHDPSLHTTEAARTELLEKLASLTEEPVEVVDQIAGVRPTSIDRRPFIGTHPEHNKYHVFNALGAKGYMLAPLLSEEFVDFLLEGKKLDREVDIARFTKKIQR